MNSNNQPDYIPKKRFYPKYYDERDHDRNRDRDRDHNRERDHDRGRDRDRLPHDSSSSYIPKHYHNFDLPIEDTFPHPPKPYDYKRKERHYITKEPKEIPRKPYVPLDRRDSRDRDSDLRDHRERSRDHDSREADYYDKRNNKRIYSYILLPKNYYNFITKNFNRLRDELHDEINDINDIQYDYNVPHFHEYVFRFSTEKIASRALAIRIISEYLFNEMRDNFQHMTYLKVSVLIPDHVIGFIIGIGGKNINCIRDDTGAKIEVYQKNNSRRFRQIELSGSPSNIAKASEKIYSIAMKYAHFDHTTVLRTIDGIDDGNKRPEAHASPYRLSNNYTSRPKERKRYVIDYHHQSKSRLEHDGNDIIKGHDDVSHDQDDGHEYLKEQMHIDTDNQIPMPLQLPLPLQPDFINNGKNDNNIQSPSKKEEEGEADGSRIHSRSRSRSLSRSQSHSISNSISHPSQSPLLPIKTTANPTTTAINNNNQLHNDSPKTTQPLPTTSLSQPIPLPLPTTTPIPPVTAKPISTNPPSFKPLEETPIKPLTTQQDLIKSFKAASEQNGISPTATCTLEVIFSSASMNILKQCKSNSNIWIELENDYHCSVSKRTQKSSNDDISIITFNGTPDANALALYQLQLYLIDSSVSSKTNL